jgi:hypothetical protein
LTSYETKELSTSHWEVAFLAVRITFPYAGLEAKLRGCASVAEQRAILDKIETKKLNQFLAWLQADGAATSALYMTISGFMRSRT